MMSHCVSRARQTVALLPLARPNFRFPRPLQIFYLFSSPLCAFVCICVCVCVRMRVGCVRARACVRSLVPRRIYECILVWGCPLVRIRTAACINAFMFHYVRGVSSLRSALYLLLNYSLHQARTQLKHVSGHASRANQNG